MAEPKQKEPWAVSKVKFAAGVVDPSSNSSLQTEFTAAKELLIEFEPELRMIVLTHMRPGADENAPRVRNPDRKSVRVPLENVLWMR